MARVSSIISAKSKFRHERRSHGNLYKLGFKGELSLPFDDFIRSCISCLWEVAEAGDYSGHQAIKPAAQALVTRGSHRSGSPGLPRALSCFGALFSPLIF